MATWAKAAAMRMFPARAGMSRGLWNSPLASAYVPRASGDEPPEADITEQMRACSPRERG